MEQFNLDGVGNRLNVYNGVTTTYTTNNLNEYTNISGTSLTYDDNGNLTGDGTYTYSYDYANRLIEVKQGETSIAVFKYDALGRRIQKTTASLTTNYYYDGGRVIEECDGLDNDTLLATYVHGNGIDEILTMERNSETYYYHENSLGSVYAVTTSTGNVVERYSYNLYGQPSFYDGSGTPISNTQISNNYLYTGREYDVETGLYNYRARYYSADLGRFLNRDPLGYVDGMNLYEYVRSNPMNYVDPWGLRAKGNAAEKPFNLELYPQRSGITDSHSYPVNPTIPTKPTIPEGKKNSTLEWLPPEEIEKSRAEVEKRRQKREEEKGKTYITKPPEEVPESLQDIEDTTENIVEPVFSFDWSPAYVLGFRGIHPDYNNSGEPFKHIKGGKWGREGYRFNKNGDLVDHNGKVRIPAEKLSGVAAKALQYLKNVIPKWFATIKIPLPLMLIPKELIDPMIIDPQDPQRMLDRYKDA